MKFETVADAVEGVPFITDENARYLYDLVLREGIEQPLELGFAHGVASCYIAAALDERGAGHLTAVDLLSAQEWQTPSIEELLDRIGLRDRVTIVREHTGYTWFLHKEIARRSQDGVCEPFYDFCIIDGPKNWTIDGAAFFMADKLLRPDGIIAFDDVDWSYHWAAGHSDETDGVRHTDLSESELHTPQIRAVAELLVMQHPYYADFVFTDGDWFIARKLAEASAAPRTASIEYIVPSGNSCGRGSRHCAARCSIATSVGRSSADGVVAEHPSEPFGHRRPGRLPIDRAPALLAEGFPRRRCDLARAGPAGRISAGVRSHPPWWRDGRHGGLRALGGAAADTSTARSKNSAQDLAVSSGRISE